MPAQLSTEDALLSGIPIGAGQVAHCDCCGSCLRPNHRVEILVTVCGSRCLACARGSLADGTERPCLLAHGRVTPALTAGSRSQLLLSGAEVVDRSDA